MYDSVDSSKIPANAAIVAGYVDGHYAWTPLDWARFPNVQHVRIAVFASTDDGMVLDVETGDATPSQAPGWVTMRRKAGIRPCVYMNASTWPLVQTSFASAHVSPPDYWVAQYDNNPAIPPGAVAKQYQSTAAYDISSTLDTWPSPPPAPPIHTEDDDMISSFSDGSQRHVFVLNTNNTVTHYWQNIAEPNAGKWFSEVLPGPA